MWRSHNRSKNVAISVYGREFLPIWQETTGNTIVRLLRGRELNPV